MRCFLGKVAMPVQGKSATLDLGYVNLALIQFFAKGVHVNSLGIPDLILSVFSLTGSILSVIAPISVGNSYCTLRSP